MRESRIIKGRMSPRYFVSTDSYVLLFSPTYINLNSSKFLNHEWVDIGLFNEYRQRTGQDSGPNASTTRSSTGLDPVRLKIEATPSSGPAASIKTEPEVTSLPSLSDIEMRTLNENGRGVLALPSDSESEAADHLDSDLEVIDALRPPSHSSSALPLSDADDFQDRNSGLPESGVAHT
ncbi:hypothetical protein B0H14DRAFT_2602581 [Mycena olivaceomarginata]|nr:hypothetical protein B0H14DRAFT_2602581 [Mycena olivaceomarginata]